MLMTFEMFIGEGRGGKLLVNSWILATLITGLYGAQICSDGWKTGQKLFGQGRVTTSLDRLD